MAPAPAASHFAIVVGVSGGGESERGMRVCPSVCLFDNNILVAMLMGPLGRRSARNRGRRERQRQIGQCFYGLCASTTRAAVNYDGGRRRRRRRCISSESICPECSNSSHAAFSRESR